jgi:hypothetical protein
VHFKPIFAPWANQQHQAVLIVQLEKGKPSQGDKGMSWKCVAPKPGKAETKTETNADGKKEKWLWCAHKKCHHWTLSHDTSGRAAPSETSSSGKPPKTENLKVQSSLKKFLSTASGAKNKLSCKDRQKLKALLTMMKHNEESDAKMV